MSLFSLSHTVGHFSSIHLHDSLLFWLWEVSGGPYQGWVAPWVESGRELCFDLPCPCVRLLGTCETRRTVSDQLRLLQ